MIISGKPIQGVLKTYGEQSRVPKTSRNEATGTGQKSDSVVLSSRAQEFGHFLQTLKKLPEAREEVVQNFTASINSGNYSVDSKGVAEKLLE